MTICEPHWGNCNGDNADGCETAIKHVRYCEGDPRIAEDAKPSVLFVSGGEMDGPGRISPSAIEAAGDAEHQPLYDCYERVLATGARVEGGITYRLEISVGGCMRAHVVARDLPAGPLDACIERFVSGLRLSRAPTAGAVSAKWELMFILGEPSGAR